MQTENLYVTLNETLYNFQYSKGSFQSWIEVYDPLVRDNLPNMIPKVL